MVAIIILIESISGIIDNIFPFLYVSYDVRKLNRLIYKKNSTNSPILEIWEKIIIYTYKIFL